MQRILIVLALLLPGTSWANYVEVKRNVNIYASPNRSAAILETIHPEELSRQIYLITANDKLQNGYHEVRLVHGSGTGWVYKSLVRLFSGDPPGEAQNAFYGGLPNDSKVGDQITHIKNAAYAVGYSETKANPLWSAYQLGTDQKYNCTRLSRFLTDERTLVRITHDSYSSSGYDRGHMAPSDNIGSRYGCDSQNETYFMSNITPQLPSLNQKSWLGLETLEATYAEQTGHIWVIAGPIFDPVWLNRLCSGVELPIAFYKIIVKEINGKPSALAVIFTQKTKPGTELSKLVTTIDEIEQRTGIDFFSKLPENVQKELESSRATDNSWELTTKLDSSFSGAPREMCLDQPVKRDKVLGSHNEHNASFSTTESF